VSNSSKQAGTRWETEVVNYLRQWWPMVDRRPLAGRYDKGDIKYAASGWTIECKNHAKLNFPMFLRQARTEAANNGDPWYVAVVKNRKAKFSSGATADAFAVMPLRVWAELAHELEDLRARHSTGMVGSPK